jgi:hypothetical protein
VSPVISCIVTSKLNNSLDNPPFAPQSAQKRRLPAVSGPTMYKRPRTNPKTLHTALENLPSIKRIETARLAAASVPSSYRVDDQAEAEKCIHAARAIDCWYFMVGTHSNDEPSNEEKAQLRLSDQARLKEVHLTFGCRISLGYAAWNACKY